MRPGQGRSPLINTKTQLAGPRQTISIRLGYMAMVPYDSILGPGHKLKSPLGQWLAPVDGWEWFFDTSEQRVEK